jgi:hypothetical protein
MSHNLPRLALIVFGLLPGIVFAQTMEAEWRVINTVSPSTLPDYQGQPNPFPMVALPEPVVEEAPTEPEISEEERTKAEVLARARDLINSNAVFRPNLDGLVFDGYLKGVQGEKVLARGQWHAVGGKFSVPVKGAEQAYQTIQALRDLDNALADEVTAELNQRLSASSRLDLKITSISNKEVVLSGAGGTFKVPVRQGGF